MTKQRYSWDRYWVPRNGQYGVDSAGYFQPPVEDPILRSFYESDAVRFDAIAHTPCLGLLGEPGIGKTYALDSAIDATRKLLTDTEASILLLDLRSYGEESRLLTAVFGSAAFQSWKKDGSRLYLFFDSLDECLLRIDTVSALLVDELKKLPSVQGLFVRIACRTADWPSLLETGLSHLWGETHFGVYELVPLSRDQVGEAARVNSVPLENFLEQVELRSAVPFAIKPLTLDFLLRTYKSSGDLPASQLELYRKGCEILCEETNESRLDAELVGELSPRERLAIASHIAATTMFCNRSAIWLGPSHLTPATDISLVELAQAAVKASGAHLEVTAKRLKEVLSTGLFTSRGPNRLGWAHQTYAEFLASSYTATQELSEKQIYDLIVHPSDPERRLIPQLHEVSAWIAGSKPEVFNEIIRRDPDVLLRSDVAAADPPTKARLIDAIMAEFIAERVWHSGRSTEAHYAKLAYPGIGEQLLKFITNRSLSVTARREAIDIARVCKIKEIIPALLNLALDPSESYGVRTDAAHTVCLLGDETARIGLKPLALGRAGDDPIDSLRGAGLQACWPAHLTAAELFESLTPPNGRVSGLYDVFLHSRLRNTLRLEHLGAALHWAERQPPKHELDRARKQALEAVLEAAADHFDDDSVVQMFARTIFRRIKKHDEVGGHLATKWREKLQSSQALRKRLVRLFLPLMTTPEHDAIYVAGWGVPFLNESDVAWLIDELLREGDPHNQECFAYMIRWLFRREDAAQIDALIEATAVNATIARVFGGFFEARELGSPAAEKERTDFFKHRKLERSIQERREARKRSGPNPDAEILTLLDEFEAGDIDAWWKLCRTLKLKDDRSLDETQHSTDISKLPGWQRASGEIRIRITKAAAIYVRRGDPHTSKWFDRKEIEFLPSTAGFKALYLLSQHEPATFQELPPAVWEVWAPTILSEMVFNNSEGHRLLASKVFEYVPKAVSDWLPRVIHQQDKNAGSLHVLQKLPALLAAESRALLIDTAKNAELTVNSRIEALSFALLGKFAGAKEYARSLITVPPPKGDPGAMALNAAKLLVVSGNSEDWNLIWSAVLADAEFGRAFVGSLTQGHHYHLPSTALPHLRESQMADLYVWMVEQFPPSQDPNPQGAHFVDEREAVGTFRNQLVSALADLGTSEACSAIANLSTRFPDQSWLRWVLARARQETRRNTWEPPLPKHLYGLGNTQRGRLVQSEGQLLDTIIDSLLLLQRKLQGETPRAQFLWNKDRPKDEESISDFVKGHLEDDLKGGGIILNREVQIRRVERTDLHIDAIANRGGSQAYDTVKVIVEVKGCWNPKLKTAMESQLVGRYLKNNDCQHGLYLVGWFLCPAWSTVDRRRRGRLFSTIDELRAFLSAESARLSSGTIRVSSLALDAALLSRSAKKAKQKVAQPSPTKGRSRVSGKMRRTVKNRQRVRVTKPQRKAAKSRSRKN